MTTDVDLPKPGELPELVAALAARVTRLEEGLAAQTLEVGKLRGQLARARQQLRRAT